MRTISSRSGPLRGEITVPGDKSISHRAVMLGSIARGNTEITGFLSGADCLSTVDCFRRLGVDISVEVSRSYVERGGLEWRTGPERFTARDPVGLIRRIEDVIRKTVGLLGRPGEELEFGMFAPFRGMLIGSLGPGPDVVNLVSDGIPLEDGTTRAVVRVGEMKDTGELERLLGLLESNYSHFTIGMGLDRLPKGDIDDSAHREGTWVTLRRCGRRGTGIKR